MIQDHGKLFISFSPSASRLDTLMIDTMSRDDTYSKLWKVVKMLLVLSQGQATVERGFSVNKQVETENLYEESVVSKRSICDYVSYAGWIQNIDVTNMKLILAATAARQKYSAYLSELHTKEAQANDAKSKKRKALQEELEQLKTKKRRLQKDAEALEKEADDLAVTAEQKHDFTCITKSNSFHKTAKQKLVDIQAVDQYPAAVQGQMIHQQLLSLCR